MKWLISLPISTDDAILDVGGGSSSFCKKLLDKGYKNITVMDIAEKALEKAKENVGDRRNEIKWMVQDVAHLWEHLGNRKEEFSVWHDRAVLHFMTTENDKKNWKKSLLTALKPGGYVIIGTFAVGGPTMCSNLPIEQYDKLKMNQLLGDDFIIEEYAQEEHTTPAGKVQLFSWFRCRRLK
eukprot:TRINITY_DN9721_c0_g1_i1.p1 TRINITY_DN9721_c0_g1~~TRINITY_DN9721_c0_g1_i1.p1  ORF type:complete len:181 (-),score=48.25 TRINITY_DN9721_c0_g1_i1:50-592(-)